MNSDISKLYARHPGIKALAALLEKDSAKVVQLSGLQGSAAPLVFAALAVKAPQTLGVPYLFVLDDEEEAGYFYHDLTQMLGQQQVLFFPSGFRRAIKFGQRDAGQEILRTEVLARLSAGTLPLFIVTYPQALCELVVTKQKLTEQTLSLSVGERVDIVFVQETLLSFGFHRADYVYEPGQFAVRGSIIDVYSFSCELPYRIDFFGDEVDSIRTFEVHSQLSRDRQQSITIVPEMGEQSLSRETFLAFLPASSMLVLKDPAFLCEMVEKTVDEGFSQQAITVSEEEQSHTADPQQPLSSEALLVQPDTFRAQLHSFRRIELSASPDLGKSKGAHVITFHTHPQPIFHKNFDLLISALQEQQALGTDIYVLADSHKQIDRLGSIFHDKETGIRFTPVDHALHGGFSDDDLHVAFYTDHQIFDRYHKYNLRSDKARSGKIALTLKELQQFVPGDLIVHVDHGIGRFDGLVRLPQGDSYQEMIKISYQGSDTIYVSIHSLYKVSKYRGKDGAENVKLNRLGTGTWENLKERTKKKIKDIARDLIVLYARRRKEKGFAFSADCFMQHELEASFLYEDTPDQLKATNDVKADMEKSQPMDRLICGDVGFGKTEVAIRAAFKAACDSKQVAVLVPTTVLAYQHYQTFSERLKGLPVRVDYLSRARSAKKVTAILSDLAEGKIDIIIGTHKLLSKTVHFKDLGLLIIDEEQKFGVSAKEKLRQIRSNVDTITMSATPIPRTLQFSLMGARDLSIIQTPPPNRYPIQTEVHTFDADLVTEAIRFEMSRNGQVFFVSNRINSLDELRYLIERNIPDARVAVGHGQMKPEELEQIVMGFINYDYDVLLSTTIVENGIDIPNANTIIINNAQNFGLSDLHQMRGRVGRGNRKAFCYLLAPPLSALPADSRKRLEAIETFSDLGSGIHLAMQDLDIRGAGNLLGAEQSGFIADLGYEVYQKILNEAITEIRNEAESLPPTSLREGTESQKVSPMGGDLEGAYYVSDCSLETDMEMCFPDSYVPSSSERMLLYRELDNLKDDEEVERYRTRLIDRFGKLPKEGEDLLKVVTLRRQGRQMGMERIVMKQGKMSLYLVSNNDSPYYQSEAFGQILHFITMHPKECALKEIKEKRFLSITNINTIDEAIKVLQFND